MKHRYQTTQGWQERDLTTAELKALAKTGNKQAIKELITTAGGWNSLSSAQKEKVTQLLFGSDVEL